MKGRASRTKNIAFRQVLGRCAETGTLSLVQEELAVLPAFFARFCPSLRNAHMFARYKTLAIVSVVAMGLVVLIAISLRLSANRVRKQENFVVRDVGAQMDLATLPAEERQRVVQGRLGADRGAASRQLARAQRIADKKFDFIAGLSERELIRAINNPAYYRHSMNSKPEFAHLFQNRAFMRLWKEVSERDDPCNASQALWREFFPWLCDLDPAESRVYPRIGNPSTAGLSDISGTLLVGRICGFDECVRRVLLHRSHYVQRNSTFGAPWLMWINVLMDSARNDPAVVPSKIRKMHDCLTNVLELQSTNVTVVPWPARVTQFDYGIARKLGIDTSFGLETITCYQGTPVIPEAKRSQFIGDDVFEVPPTLAAVVDEIIGTFID